MPSFEVTTHFVHTNDDTGETKTVFTGSMWSGRSNDMDETIGPSSNFVHEAERIAKGLGLKIDYDYREVHGVKHVWATANIVDEFNSKIVEVCIESDEPRPW